MSLVENKLTELPIPKIVVEMALPMIWGILSIVAFNLIDTLYLGNYGEDELTAISFTFPVVAFFASLALGVATATSSLVSRALGEKKHSEAALVTVHSLIFAILLVIICVAVGFISLDFLFHALGARGRVLDLAVNYMEIWYSGMIFVTVPMVGNGAIRATGDTKTAARIMIIAALLNAIVDPILIFGFWKIPPMGIEGAAYATVFARATTFIFSLLYLKYKFKLLNFSGLKLVSLFSSWRKILWIAVPAAGTNVITPLIGSITTVLVASFGEFSIAALGIVVKVESFAMIIIFALSSALGPIIGQNFGANKGERISRAFYFSSFLAIGWALTLTIFFSLWGDEITRLFNSNPLIVEEASDYYLWVPVSLGFYGVRVLGGSFFNAIGRPVSSTILILIHFLVFYLPSLFIMAKYMGMKGVFVSMGMANLLSGILTFFVVKKIFENLNNGNIHDG